MDAMLFTKFKGKIPKEFKVYERDKLAARSNNRQFVDIFQVKSADAS